LELFSAVPLSLRENIENSKLRNHLSCLSQSPPVLYAITIRVFPFIFLFVASVVAQAVTIENPVHYFGKLLEVNGYSVLDYKKYDENGNLLSSGSVRGTMQSKDDFGGEEIKVIKMNTSETPVGGAPEANEIYEVYIDDDFAFNNTVSSLKTSTSILNRSVGKAPSTSTVTVNQTWKNIAYRSGFTEVTTQAGKMLTLPVRVVIESNSSFSRLESIETIWGTKSAIVVQTQKLIVSGNQDWNDGSYSYRNTFQDTPQTVTTYFVKGVGIYKIVTVTEPSSYTTTATYVPTNTAQSISYPSPKTTEVLTYEYSTRNLTAGDFSVVTQDSSSGSSLTLDSWMWYGAYPWVYNSSTSSWFYYSVNGNSRYVYDARTSRWFAYNESTNSWASSP
jgi:hypothetical protein